MKLIPGILSKKERKKPKPLDNPPYVCYDKHMKTFTISFKSKESLF